MTIADIQKVAAEAVASAMGMRLTQAADAPAVAVASPTSVKRRTLTDAQKARMADGRRRAAAAKAGGAATVARPASKPAEANRTAEKPAKTAEAWSVKDHVTKRGIKGKVITVGPFSAWLPEGNEARRQAVMDAIVKVFRTAEISKVIAQF